MRATKTRTDHKWPRGVVYGAESRLRHGQEDHNIYDISLYVNIINC